MARLSKMQEQTRLQMLQLESLSLLPEAASSRILAALRRSIPYDESVLFGVDPSSLLFNRILAFTGTMGVWLDWLQWVYLAREPFAELTFPGLMQANLTTIAIHDYPQTSLGIPTQTLDRVLAVCTPKEWHHIYHDNLTPVSGTLRTSFAAKGRWIAAMELGRRESRQAFRPTEVSFMRSLAPLIGRILQAAYERERALKTGAVGADVSGILVLGANQQEQFCNPAAEEWIRRLGDQDTQREGKFPIAVWAAIARLNANHGKPDRALHVWTSAGNLRIEASRSERDGSTAIVFTPERPPMPPDIPIHWQLTPQERQVVGLLFQGLSNAQIAAALVVSETTIESHLSHVYEKLSVHSRRELLASLFHDVYWSQMQPFNKADRSQIERC